MADGSGPAGSLTGDPMLGPLADNGGPTLTHLPQPGSPVVDAGDNALVPSGVTTDQRGAPRISGAAVDLGSVEVLPSEATAPTVLFVTSSTPDGSYGAGAVISIQVNFDQDVTVTGTPQLQLNSGPGAVASYTSGSGTHTLTFTYTVQAGHNSPALDYTSTTALTPNGGTILGPAGAPADLTLPAPGTPGSLGANTNLVTDTTAPTLAITPNGVTTTASPIVFTFQFSEPVTGFAAGDVVVTGGTPGAFTTINGANYTLAVTPAGPGSVTVTVAAGAAQDLAGNGNIAASASVTVPEPPPPPPPPPPAVVGTLAVGSGPGTPGRVNVLDPLTGALRFAIAPFAGFAGGVRVATGDVSGDGTADVIVGAGPGAPGGHVKVFDGRTGVLLQSFLSFPGFAGGVFVAGGDVNGDGTADIVVGADAGAGPHVKVFDGRTGALLASFFAFGPGFRGGVTVAAGDVNGDGRADVVVGAGAGGGTHVVAVDARQLTRTQPDGQIADSALLASFLAYSGFGGGVFVGAGDLDGDGRADIVTGAGGPPHVKAFNGTTGALMASFLTGDPAGQGVAVTTADRGGRRDVVTGAGTPAAPATLRAFDGRSFRLSGAILAFDPPFDGPVFVGS